MITAVSTSAAGARQVINTRGTVGGVQFTSAASGGDTACQFTVAIPADANPPGLATGRQLALYDGPVRVWSGIVADAQRGTPWQVAGQGLSSLADRYLALDATGLTTADPNVAVTQAVTRGLPWLKLLTLAAPSGVTPSGSDVGHLLDATSTAAGLLWGVDQNGQLFQGAPRTTPDYLMVASNTLAGRTMDQFATDEYVRYSPPLRVLDQTTGSYQITAGQPTVVAAPNNPAAAAPRPYGRWEHLDDITGQGPVTTSAAGMYANGQLSLEQPRSTLTGSIPVQPGDLRSPGGAPVRLSTVRAGQVIRTIGVQPDPALGELIFSLAVTVVIGQWTYDADNDLGTLTPLGAPARPVLAAPQLAWGFGAQAAVFTAAPGKSGSGPGKRRAGAV